MSDHRVNVNLRGERELGTGVPMVYRLNADSTVAERLDLAA